jgi:PIN domain nuclease of toxin-antitoxin system
VSGLLLDTHALIWWMIEPTRLSAEAYEAIGNPDLPTMVSVVSAYEIELKRGKDPTLDRLPSAMVGIVPLLGFSWLTISPQDGFDAGRLSATHRDP